MGYMHFSVEEREEIQRGLWRGESIRAIAKRLRRSHGSVSREIARVAPVWRTRYNPRRAHEEALRKRHRRGRELRLKDDRLRGYVVSRLKEGWSPEQIAGRARLDGVGSISHEAIYQFVYAQMQFGNPSIPWKGHEDLRRFLRRRRKRRLPHGARRNQRITRPKPRSIEERPEIVRMKGRFGDWESDTVVGGGGKRGINTTNERRIGLVFITRLSGKRSADTVKVLARRFAAVPAHLRHTITVDNGPEWSDWEGVERATGMLCFAAHPYCSGERGANENTNGLIRQFFPKGTDFTTVSDADLADVEYRLNTRPRKRLGWKTPLEVWNGAITS